MSKPREKDQKKSCKYITKNINQNNNQNRTVLKDAIPRMVSLPEKGGGLP